MGLLNSLLIEGVICGEISDGGINISIPLICEYKKTDFNIKTIVFGAQALHWKNQLKENDIIRIIGALKFNGNDFEIIADHIEKIKNGKIKCAKNI